MLEELLGERVRKLLAIPAKRKMKKSECRFRLDFLWNSLCPVIEVALQ